MSTILYAVVRRKFTVLAVVAAITVATASTALAGTGVGGVFNLGVVNTVNALTTLKGVVGGASLRIDNDSAGPGATALQLLVEPGKPPLSVNSETKVAKLNADRLDGQDAVQLGQKLIQGSQFLSDICAGVGTDPTTGAIVWGECSPITVTVPANKTYIAHISSQGSFYESSNENDVTICASHRLSTEPVGSRCDFSNSRGLEVQGGEKEVGAQESVVNLDGGPSGATYVLGTALNSTDGLNFESPDNALTQTTVQITDATGAVPAGLSAAEVKVAKAQERGSKR